MMNISNASEPKYELFFLVMINNSINIIHNGGMSIYWDGTICFRRGVYINHGGIKIKINARLFTHQMVNFKVLSLGDQTCCLHQNFH